MSAGQIIFDAYAQSGEAAVIAFDAQPTELAWQIAELTGLMIGSRLPAETQVKIDGHRVLVYVLPQQDFEGVLENLAMEIRNAYGVRPLRGFMTRQDYLNLLQEFE